MSLRRLLIIAGLLLIFFLAMYSWNRRTGFMDDLSTNVGLELTAAILSPLRTASDFIGNFWERYFDLVNVREENIHLKKRVEILEAQLIAHGEDLAELRRLRALVQFPIDVRWRPLAAKVLAGRLGPNAVLDSITISRGYANGAKPGTPLVTNLGLVGKVLRSSAHASTALLISNPGSRISVFGQESRAPGILKGHGLSEDLEVDFVQRDVSLKEGEVLVTSGLDNKYPRGLPVARVNKVAPSDYTQFMAVSARPLVDLQHLEEVLLLEKSGIELPMEIPEEPGGAFVGPPLPPHLAKAREQATQSAQENSQNTGDSVVSENAPQAKVKPGAQANRKPRQTAPATPAYRVITP